MGSEAAPQPGQPDPNSGCRPGSWAEPALLWFRGFVARAVGGTLDPGETRPRRALLRSRATTQPRRDTGRPREEKSGMGGLCLVPAEPAPLCDLASSWDSPPPPGFGVLWGSRGRPALSSAGLAGAGHVGSLGRQWEPGRHLHPSLLPHRPRAPCWLVGAPPGSGRQPGVLSRVHFGVR